MIPACESALDSPLLPLRSIGFVIERGVQFNPKTFRVNESMGIFTRLKAITLICQCGKTGRIKPPYRPFAAWRFLVMHHAGDDIPTHLRAQCSCGETLEFRATPDDLSESAKTTVEWMGHHGRC